MVVHQHGRAKTILDPEHPLGRMDQELSTRMMEAELPMDPAHARPLGKLVLGHQLLEMRSVLVHVLRLMLAVVVVTAGIPARKHLPGAPLLRRLVPAATIRGATRLQPLTLHTMPRLQEAPCRPLLLAL